MEEEARAQTAHSRPGRGAATFRWPRISGAICAARRCRDYEHGWTNRAARWYYREQTATFARLCTACDGGMGWEACGDARAITNAMKEHHANAKGGSTHRILWMIRSKPSMDHDGDKAYKQELFGFIPRRGRPSWPQSANIWQFNQPCLFSPQRISSTTAGLCPLVLTNIWQFINLACSVHNGFLQQPLGHIPWCSYSLCIQQRRTFHTPSGSQQSFLIFT